MEYKEQKKRTIIAYTEYEGDVSSVMTENEEAVTMMHGFARLLRLYSCFVDINGRLIDRPVGPDTNIGDFYDLFETPAYKQYYMRIKAVVLEHQKPHLFKREEGGVGRFSVAPIGIDDKLLGFWILGSYTEKESAQLHEFLQDHWTVAYSISSLIVKNRTIKAEMEKARVASQRLEDELTRESIINAAWSKINSNLINNVDTVLEELLASVGNYLGLTKAFFYTRCDAKAKTYRMRVCWSATAAEDTDGRISAEDTKEKTLNIAEEMFALEQSPAVQTYPILMNDTLYGKLFYVADDSKVWLQKELAFAKTISILVQNMIETAEGDDNIRRVNNHLIETYNSFNVGIFIKDAASGEVLFSNAALNGMLGHDFTGGSSREILTDLHDRFDNIPGMRKSFMAKDRVENWRSYIQRFDAIMDITEIQIEWLQGQPASFIILRKANDL